MTNVRMRVIEGYNIFLSTFKEEFDSCPPEHHRDILKNVLKTGGAFFSIITQEESEKIKKVGIIMPPGPAVFIMEDFFELHAKEEALAILYHEIGHIRAGHYNKAKAEGVNTVDGIIDCVEYELEADSYAASKTSRLHMANGLKKTIESIGRVAKQYYELLGEDLTAVQGVSDAILALTSIQTRLQALQD